MPPRYIHAFAIDPGGTTGWAHAVIPRRCMFGPEDTSIASWGTGELTGSEDEQAIKLSSMIREIQGLDYLVGPAVICEDFDFGNPNRDPMMYSPVRIAAKLKLLHHMGKMGDARFVMQSRTIAKSTMTDERLKEYGFWVRGSAHERDAMRHLITALRRAKQKKAVRDKLWPARQCIILEDES